MIRLRHGQGRLSLCTNNPCKKMCDSDQNTFSGMVGRGSGGGLGRAWGRGMGAGLGKGGGEGEGMGGGGEQFCKFCFYLPFEWMSRLKKEEIGPSSLQE